MRRITMLRCLSVLLALVTVCWLGHTPAVAQRPEGVTTRVYKFQSPIILGGWAHVPGSRVDVIFTVPVSEGGTVSRRIVTGIVILGSRRHLLSDHELVAVMVTPAQASKLDRA